jgi:hypothetical protein
LNHLLNTHGIELDTNEHPIKKQRGSLIKDAFAKAGAVNTTKQSVKEEVTLRAAVNQKAALEALVQLVTVRNLSYNCSFRLYFYWKSHYSARSQPMARAVK